MSTDLRQRVIMWLENTRNSGAFIGFEEEYMDFNNLSDTDIQWYWEHRVQYDVESQDNESV